MARPGFQVTKEVIAKAESLAATGLTLEQIAHCLGISYQTLNEKSKIYPEFVEAIKRGQAKGISIVANALFESARSGNTTAQIFFMKCRAKWYDIPHPDSIDNHDSMGNNARDNMRKYSE